MLKVQHLKKNYNQLEVLKDINFEVKTGEVLAIIGPSGSGKSTLLRCLNFLEKPNSGTIQFKDQVIDCGKVTKQQIAYIRQNSAMVFQQFNLFRFKTALENVTEALIHVKKMKKNEAIDEAVKQLQLVGMLERKDHYPNALSGGQKQRVGIARALAMHPDVILFDEPTSALDPEMIGEVLDVIKEAKKQGHTMIIVSHEMDFVCQMADQVIFMDGGYIIEQGDPKEMFIHPCEERTKQFLKRVRFNGGNKNE